MSNYVGNSLVIAAIVAGLSVWIIHRRRRALQLQKDFNSIYLDIMKKKKGQGPDNE